MTQDAFNAAGSRQELASFLATLCEDLNTTIALRGYLFAPVGENGDGANEELLYLMDQAWAEARGGVPELILAALYPSPSQALGLERAGLTGAQLRFKVAAWRISRLALLEAFRDSDDPDTPPDFLAQVPPQVIRQDEPLPRRRPRFKKWALKKLSQVFAHGDTILESFASAVSLGHALEEIKKVTERMSNDWSDALPDEKT